MDSTTDERRFGRVWSKTCQRRATLRTALTKSTHKRQFLSPGGRPRIRGSARAHFGEMMMVVVEGPARLARADMVQDAL